VAIDKIELTANNGRLLFLCFRNLRAALLIIRTHLLLRRLQSVLLALRQVGVLMNR